MVFCMIITSVVVAEFPIYFELALSASVTDPIERISIALVRSCFMVSVANPMAVVLSTFILVGGWG